MTRFPFSHALEGNCLIVSSLAGLIYRLDRTAIVGAAPAAWRGWTFVWLRHAKQPLLVRCHGSVLRGAHLPGREFREDIRLHPPSRCPPDSTGRLAWGPWAPRQLASCHYPSSLPWPSGRLLDLLTALGYETPLTTPRKMEQRRASAHQIDHYSAVERDLRQQVRAARSPHAGQFPPSLTAPCKPPTQSRLGHT